MSREREQFASRVGFILMSAGCAIGLGNIWRFPFIAGQYGGGFFVLLYLLCLLLLGFPVLLLELAVGRAGRSSLPVAFRVLENKRQPFRWGPPSCLFFAGNLILLMFYSVITGWVLIYTEKFFIGSARVMKAEFFQEMLASPGIQIFHLLVSVAVTCAICAGGIRDRIEKSMKFMMGGLFLLLFVLIVKANLLPGSVDGLKFFLTPDWSNFIERNPWGTVHAAMTQAFFTLSLGIGAIAIFGSYIGRERGLVSEAIWIVSLDTLVAVCAGIIIFPTCFSFGIRPDAGPSLIFITLPKVFRDMNGGFLWGGFFFLFLFIAALSTLIAVFENLVAFGMDQLNWSRKKSCLVFSVLLIILSLPCIFGFNLWSSFHPLGKDSTILDLEDFIVSDNLIPLGSIYLTVFCMSRYGWGKENCFTEINTGRGIRLPGFFLPLMTWGIPLLILVIWATGIVKRFF